MTDESRAPTSETADTPKDDALFLRELAAEEDDMGGPYFPTADRARLHRIAANLLRAASPAPAATPPADFGTCRKCGAGCLGDPLTGYAWCPNDKCGDYELVLFGRAAPSQPSEPTANESLNATFTAQLATARAMSRDERVEYDAFLLARYGPGERLYTEPEVATLREHLDASHAFNLKMQQRADGTEQRLAAAQALTMTTGATLGRVASSLGFPDGEPVNEDALLSRLAAVTAERDRLRDGLEELVHIPSYDIGNGGAFYDAIARARELLTAAAPTTEPGTP